MNAITRTPALSGHPVDLLVPPPSPDSEPSRRRAAEKTPPVDGDSSQPDGGIPPDSGGDNEKKKPRKTRSRKPKVQPEAVKPTTPDRAKTEGSQFNVRLALEIQKDIEATAAGMTLVTGAAWTKSDLVRNAIEVYLDQLYREFNDGKPFRRV